MTQDEYVKEETALITEARALADKHSLENLVELVTNHGPPIRRPGSKGTVIPYEYLYALRYKLGGV